MSIELKKAYARGYYAALNKHWPTHLPPVPSEPVVAELMNALRALRDTCDAFRATLMPDDDFGAELEPAITRADAALCGVSAWLQQQPNG